MTVYRARVFGNVFAWDSETEQPRVLPPRLDLRNHSPTGFAWSYSGSGPAQLALALLCDVLGDDERALRLYQRFKAQAIATMPNGSKFEMTSSQVLKHVEQLEKQA